MTPSTASHYDMTIVGSGMVGCVLAIALAPFVESILLLDHHLIDIDREPQAHSRPITLNATSVASLQALGVWETLCAVATPLKQVHVSQSGYFGTCQFSAKEFGLEALAYVVPADCLGHALAKKALSLQTVTHQCIASLDALSQDADTVQLNVTAQDKQQQLHSHFVFGCDGTHSTVANLMGAHYEKTGEILSALLCDIDNAMIGTCSYERFTSQGTLALLPKLHQAAGLVFTGSAKDIDALMALDAVAFMQAIQDWMGHRLSPLAKAGKRTVRSLESGEHHPMAKRRVCLLGNAARTLYPIAAQGFNLGLRDVMQLQEIFQCAHAYETPYDPAIIETLVSMRQEDQQGTKQMVSRIRKIFDMDFPGVSHIRALGLMGLDRATPVKKRLAKRALGVLGKVQRVVKLKTDDIASQ